MRKMLSPEIESHLIQKGTDFVIGIDEVGRGPWAGPMYLGAYIYSGKEEVLEGVNDSKLLSIKLREDLYTKLSSHKYIFKPIEIEEIDRKGLGVSINEGLTDLVQLCRESTKGKSVKFLIDGYFKGEWGEDVEFIKKGDSKVYSIACASILAKVKRDRIMYELAKEYPEYGFDTHVGYGTKKHKEALEKYGIIDGVHRISFKPVKKLIK